MMRTSGNKNVEFSKEKYTDSTLVRLGGVLFIKTSIDKKYLVIS